MPRANYDGLSKSKDGTYFVHYQHHNPTLRINIKSKPGQYFCIKQSDKGELSVKYYDKILKIGYEKYDYAAVLHELYPEFNGNDIDADTFIKNNQDRLTSLIKTSISNYCANHNKERKKYDIIQNGSDTIWIKLSEIDDKGKIFHKFCELIKCTREDLVLALKEYYLQKEEYIPCFAKEQNARERSIVHHYPG